MKIDIGNVNVFVFKVDETRFKVSLFNVDPPLNAYVYTLVEIEDKPYYNDVKNFLTVK